MLILTVIAVVGATGLNAAEAAEKTGEQLFVEHCALCHPDGGNIITPDKTLRKKDLDANKIKTAEDVVKIMRKPGQGMTAFDIKSLSDKDARKIADYIFKKFKK